MSRQQKQTTKKLSYSKSANLDTKRSTSLSVLYKDIRPYKPLSKKEINTLIMTYYSSDDKEKKDAFNKLCKHNMLLVVSMAKAYCSANDNLDDLIQEGNIGLMKAIEMFDMRKGVPFSNYAAYWIRRYINMYKTNMTPIIAQTNKSKTGSVINKITNELYQRLEREPTPNEILSEYNASYPAKKISDSRDVCNVEYVFIDKFNNQSNINEPVRYNESYDYNCASCSENDYIDDINKENNKMLCKVFTSCLSEKEKFVITRMFGLDGEIECGITSISQEMGLTEQRIRQLYDSAIEKMKNLKEKQSFTFKK